MLLATIGWMFGPTSLIATTTGMLLIVAMADTAIAFAFAICTCAFLGHHFQSIERISGLTFHIGSSPFIILPAIVACTSLNWRIGWSGVLTILLAATTVLIGINLSAAIWINHNTLTSQYFRLAASVLPIAIAALAVSSGSTQCLKMPSVFWMLGGVTIGALVTFAAPQFPVSQIVFDEAHGRWETVRATFGPNDFGRSANYTYSLLERHADRLVGSTTLDNEGDSLPPHALFVLKMPTTALSDEFSSRLYQWISDGGRLLVVADHTDLYDTTQNLNLFLQLLGVSINSDAVFDTRGMPTVPETEQFAFFLGRIDAYAKPLPWQTGASFGRLPANAVELASYGPSFSEPGDYSRPNRFGPFLPRSTLRFTKHTAVAAFSVGAGAVAIILDSTPWSNFSIFIDQYTRLFRSIVFALSNPIAIKIWGWAALLLPIAGIAVLVWRTRTILVLGGAVLGLVVGAASQIGALSHLMPVEGRDFGLKVQLGNSARLEFLKQLVGSGDRNFSRIISAMAKYGLNPSAELPGTDAQTISTAKRWLFIQPEFRTLPNIQVVLRHLKAGGDLTILFGPEQGQSMEIETWLRSLGLNLRKTVALAVAEDAYLDQGGLLTRRGPSIIRDVRPVTSALPTSILKPHDGDQFFQSYTLRPTTLPRTSGRLTVGFSADQFSDDAVGEVWEGTNPASIGRLRERQLASALLGEDFPAPFPSELAYVQAKKEGKALTSYLVMEDGRTIITGKFESVENTTENVAAINPSANPVGYLQDLRSRALSFVDLNCPLSGKVTFCERRMLGPDMTEWMVSWAADMNGAPVALELLHERRFSGLGSTVNVVFGE